MSLRRAAMRREKREREKALKSRSPDGELARAKEQGKIDGRALAVFISSIYLHEDFRWGANRILEMIEKGNKEAARFDNEGVWFAFNFYADKIAEKLNQQEIGAKIVKTVAEKVYYDSRNDFFISGLATVISVLSSDYNFGWNTKGTGRLDRLTESVVAEYMNVLEERTSIEVYQERILEEIGINFKEG